MNKDNKKLRVWWAPQIPMKPLYIPVETPEEGKKIMDILAVYDLFQLENNIKPDFCNMGGLQMYNEEEKEWEDWYMETESDYFDDVDEYCDSDCCEQSEELIKFGLDLFEQL